MKMFLFGFCLIILLTNLASKSSAMPIGISSSDYHIWGIISGMVVGPYGLQTQLSDSYDLYSSGQPLSRSVTFEEEYPSSFFLAASNVGTFDTSVESLSYTYGGIARGNPNAAYADATWVFSTPGNQVSMDFDWSYLGERSKAYAFGEIWLVDLRAGTELFYLKPSPSSDWGTLDGHYTLDLDLDPTHLYSLEMFSQATSADDNIGYHINATINVPEPSTLFLLGVGIFGLLFVGKRLKWD
jgi:hypothetical protein